MNSLFFCQDTKRIGSFLYNVHSPYHVKMFNFLHSYFKVQQHCIFLSLNLRQLHVLSVLLLTTYPNIICDDNGHNNSIDSYCFTENDAN